MINWSQIEHFKQSEFTCNCGCGTNNINADLVLRLDEARRLSNIPFVITRGCSCRQQNLRVGGDTSSSHLFGNAVDISIPNSSSRFIILKSLLDLGFKRIGIYKKHIHIDNDLDKSNNVCWYV